MTRKVLKYNNFKPITKYLKKFNLRSFVNKKKIQSYMNFHPQIHMFLLCCFADRMWLMGIAGKMKKRILWKNF